MGQQVTGKPATRAQKAPRHWREAKTPPCLRAIRGEYSFGIQLQNFAVFAASSIWAKFWQMGPEISVHLKKGWALERGAFSSRTLTSSLPSGRAAFWFLAPQHPLFHSTSCPKKIIADDCTGFRAL